MCCELTGRPVHSLNRFLPCEHLGHTQFRPMNFSAQIGSWVVTHGAGGLRVRAAGAACLRPSAWPRAIASARVVAAGLTAG
jgi:hypothetical protein